MDVRSTLALQGYSQARPATQPDPSGFTARAGAMAEDFAASLQQTEQTAMAAMGGEADPQALVEALSQTKLAVETAVTVRDKVVEAYNQILRMPV